MADYVGLTWAKNEHLFGGGIAPTLCSNLLATYGTSNVVLKWSDPVDTFYGDRLISSWMRTTIVRKKGSYPKNIEDGIVICVNDTRDTYATNGFTDSTITAGETTTDYYYAAFPMSDTYSVSTNAKNRFNDHVLYTFKVLKSDSASGKGGRVVYTGNTAGLTPAYMDYTAGTFNYGSFKNAFFMPKPCMLKTTGSVDYYLNPDDYRKKEDGTASDIGNSAYDGNAMMQFPTVWIYRYTDGTYDYYNVSNVQINSNYQAYAHHDWYSNVIPFIYLPIYEGSIINGKMRSISSQALSSVNITTSAQTSAAAANGTGYYIECLADFELIKTLLWLISGSTDTQTVFGKGNCQTSAALSSGTMNTKGLFWGDQTGTNGVKLFGMENWWGNVWKRMAGLINASGTIKYKSTYGTEDGTTAKGWNESGSGYLSLGVTPSGTSGGYISASVTNNHGTFAIVASGSATTYECDGLWFDNSITAYASVGGGWNAALSCGTSAVALGSAASVADASIGASLSCKPTLAA